MKRSERIFSQARRKAQWAWFFLVAGIAAGVWTVRAFQSGPAGGLFCLLVALTVFVFAVRLAGDAWRLLLLAEHEERWELL